MSLSLISSPPFRPSLHCSKPSPPSSLRFHFPLKLLRPPPPSPALRSSTDSAPSLIFLPHLESEGAEEEEEEEEEVDYELREEGGDEEAEGGENLVGKSEFLGEDDEEYFDPIIDFFRSRSPPEDPKCEGRLTLQRNRRTAWHIAGNADLQQQTDFDSDEDDQDEELPEEQGRELDSGNTSVESSPELEIVEEIMSIARKLPENMTLGDCLCPFAGKVGEGECIELLKRMGDEGLVRGCLYLFEWMGLQEPSLVTPRACSVLFPVLGRAGMGDKLKVVFENLPKVKRFRDICVYNSAISGLACCGRYDDAWRVYEALEANNIRPDHVTCSILITIMRKKGQHAKDAWEFFERMDRKGVKWSLEAIGALIKSFCDEGLKKEALIFQSEMEKKGIASNAIIYNTLMNAYSKNDQIEEAEGLFLELKEKGLKPTVSTYNILMDAYSRRMQPEVVETLLSEMQNLGLKPNVKSYTCLISAYGRQRKMSDLAADSFLRMKKAGIKPTSHSYTALIHAYSVGGWHEKAYAAYESMKREGIPPSIETYTTLLDALRRGNETEKLVELWKTMLNSKVECTRVTYNIVLDGLAKHGLYDQARDVMHEFEKMGLPPSVMTYNILMNAYARGGQHCKFPQLLKEMEALELKPDSVTYSTMIYACIRVRDFSRAFYYHKHMVRNGQVPEPKSYHKLRSILEDKAKTKNRRDRSAILGIVNSKFSLKAKKGKKDEFWKFKKKRTL